MAVTQQVMNVSKCKVYARPQKANSERVFPREISRNNAWLPSWQLKQEAFAQVWNPLELEVKHIIELANDDALEDVERFIASDAITIRESENLLPIALVTTGRSFVSQQSLVQQLVQRLSYHADSKCVTVNASEGTNLKMLIKNLFYKLTAPMVIDESDLDPLIREHEARSTSGTSENYPLAIASYIIKHHLRNFIVILQDCEAFDPSVLHEAIRLFSVWREQIPTVFIFALSSSLHSFENILSSSSLSYIHGNHFDTLKVEEVFDRVFHATIAKPCVRLWLGSCLSANLIARHADQTQSLDSFCDSIKYAYMSNFFASPLSIFLRDGTELADVTSKEVNIARSLPSFRRYIERILSLGDTAQVRLLLYSDSDLFELLRAQVKIGQATMSQIAAGIDVLSVVRECVTRSTPIIARSTLYVRAASGRLLDSPLLRETLMTLNHVSPDDLVELRRRLSDLEYTDTCKCSLPHQQDYEHLSRKFENIVGQKSRCREEFARTGLSRISGKETELDNSGGDSTMIPSAREFRDQLAEYFEGCFKNPLELTFHEIFLYDSRSPCVEAFAPRPRAVIERALLSPHDYLDCQCCIAQRLNNQTKDEQHEVLPSYPPCAVLYHLHLESGAHINIGDLWHAFKAFNKGSEDSRLEKLYMAVFQNAVSELYNFGMLRQNRTKIDHLAKTMWKGI